MGKARCFIALSSYYFSRAREGRGALIACCGTCINGLADFYDCACRRRAMRNTIFAINITLDGCCDHTKMISDEEIHEYFTHLMRDVDLLVFGRKTYQLMVPFWPDVAKNHSTTKAMNEFADTFDSINKIGFFTTIRQN
jgi:hypothetical protein